MAAASNKQLAALVILVALLGPLAGQGQGQLLLPETTRLRCYVGWIPVLRVLVCPLLSKPFPGPKDPPTGYGLSEDHYYRNGSYCPRAEQIVKEAVVNATKQTPDIGAGLIRLHFHDAFVRGCDASVLLNKTASENPDTERTAGPNRDSLRGFEVIDAAKAALERECPGIVSCADILAFAARDASYILSYGRINYTVPAGRYDGVKSEASETNQLPGPDSDLQELTDAFAAQGLSREDMVTLSAAHSSGNARCMFFTGRLSAMDSGYAKELNTTCNGTGSPSTRVHQDRYSPYVLDNQYYKNIDKFVLFGSDAALKSSQTFPQVDANARNATKWEIEFGAAMQKMGKIGVITSPGDSAQIRTRCWQVNTKKY